MLLKVRTHTIKFGASISHINWTGVGTAGGISFNIYHNKTTNEEIAGLEYHSRTPTSQRPPDHKDCAVLDGPCWHEGTSLYATDVLLPRVIAVYPDHELIFNLLEVEYYNFFHKESK